MKSPTKMHWHSMSDITTNSVESAHEFHWALIVNPCSHLSNNNMMVSRTLCLGSLCRQQLARRAVQRRMLQAWAAAARSSRHVGLLTAAAHNLAGHHCQRRAWGCWTGALALARGAARCHAHQRRNRTSMGFAAWRRFTADAV